MKTLNQIISQVTDLGAAHSQIAETGVGTFEELQANERTYPLLWVFHEGSNIDDAYFTNNLRLTVFDRVITGEEGDDTAYSEQEVLSDTQLILLDVFNYFKQQHAQEYVIQTTASIIPFTEKTNDRTAGNTMTFGISQFYDFNKCQIPESGAAIPPSVDGLTLYDFCDAGTRARLTSAQVTCLQSNLCTAATTQVNAVDVGTVASGGTWDQAIHDSAGADVGTAANPSVVSDSTNKVNAVDISDPTVAEGEHDQQIHDSAGTDVGTAANPSVVSDATVENSDTSWTDTVVAEGTMVLADAKALDSDETTTLTAPYIPAADGFMFTCTPSACDNFTWNRDPNWNAMPTVIAGDERFVALVLVFENGVNALNVLVTNLTADIDYGDGTNVTSDGTVQEHIYDYATVSGAVNVYEDGRNYKQVFLDITRIGGAITSISFTGLPASGTKAPNNMVDVICDIPNVTSFLFSSATTTASSICERVNMVGVKSNLAVSSMFKAVYRLNSFSFPFASHTASQQSIMESLNAIYDMGDVVSTGTTLREAFKNSMIRKHGDLTSTTITTAQEYCSGCATLTSFGDITLSIATSVANFFNSDRSLTKHGTVNVPNATSINGFANNCFSNRESVFTDCALITSVTTAFANNYSLEKLIMPGLTRGLILRYSNLDTAAWNALGDSIGTASGAQNYDARNTPGSSTLTTSIFTDKGYTITTA